MNNKLSITFLALISAFLLSCHGPEKQENNPAPVNALSFHPGDEKYAVVNTKESVVTWKGSMLMGANSHTGYVYVSKGELLIEKDQVKGGIVEVDMNTIEDDNHQSDNNLIKHLKDPDFFDVKKFPFSTIAITNVASINEANKNITGDLTIKGITHPVSFPAQLEMKDGVVKANGRLVIDRTAWDVRYKSRKFYALLADQTMSDSIEFRIRIVAKK
jgi:polyisoprenoid-binding protein YceI